MSKRVVVSGYYGFDNFGDEAILSLLINYLKKNCFDVVVLSADPRKTSMNYFVNSINSFDFFQVSGIIKHSDFLISGGGSLLQDVTSLKSLLYYLWVIFLALRYKKKIIIFAQGIGPIKNKLAKLLTIFILKRCDYVSVRDLKSAEFLNGAGVKASLLCDPIFSLNLNLKNSKGIVGVQLRDFYSMNDFLLNRLARQVIKDFYDKKIRIFSFQDSLDLSVCVRFNNILKSLKPDMDTEIVHELDISQVIDKISELEYMIAMRFHALIVAMKMGIKTVAINYDVKVQKLAAEADIPLISMSAGEDFDKIFSDMKCLNGNRLKEFSDNQRFDWSGIDEVLQIK